MAITSGTGEWITKRVHKQTWSAIPNGNQGSSLSAAHLSDKCVQVTGTFGVGGSVTIKGSNDGGTTWANLTDPGGTVITFTATGMKQILENPQLIRPDVTAGDGSTALNVFIVSKGEA